MALTINNVLTIASTVMRTSLRTSNMKLLLLLLLIVTRSSTTAEIARDVDDVAL